MTKGSKLPETDSIEELARFWDSHSITDFEDQLEEVHEGVFKRRPAASMTLRLDPEELDAVQRIARSRGLEQSELLREWVIEKIGTTRS
jgi:predicted DNA binding CopG/RHH family protein